MKEALNSIRVKKQTVKEIDVYAHENYVHPLLDYIINDLQDFRSKYSDPSLGALAVCNSKEQAIMMYRCFWKTMQMILNLTIIQVKTDK